MFQEWCFLQQIVVAKNIEYLIIESEEPDKQYLKIKRQRHHLLCFYCYAFNNLTNIYVDLYILWKVIPISEDNYENTLREIPISNLPVESNSSALILSVCPLSFMVLEPDLGSQTRTTYKRILGNMDQLEYCWSNNKLKYTTGKEKEKKNKTVKRSMFNIWTK